MSGRTGKAATAAKKRTAASTKAAKDRAVLKVFDGLMAEKAGAVPSELVDAVERETNGAGVHAVYLRAALVYLATPFKQSADAIRTNRKTAISFANIALCIRDSAERYKELAEFMHTAKTRIRIALAQREDILEILAIAEAERERPTLQ